MAEQLLLERLENYIKQRWIPEPETLAQPSMPGRPVKLDGNNYYSQNGLPDRSMGSAPAKKAAPVKKAIPMPAEKKRRSILPSFPSLFSTKEARQERSAEEAPAPSYPAPRIFEDTVQGTTLDERLKYLDESFSQMLLRKIDEAGIKDSECYNRAHLNRALFNKIKNDPTYRTSKETAVALGLALQLKKPEFTELLAKAGYSFSRCSKFDIIIEFCLENSIFNIMEVNELLFTHDQTLLGAK